MNPSAQIDLYCERTDWSFWSEPLNALTNLAFLLAAALIVARVRREEGRLPWDAGVLAALTALVGVGSFLFHTFATVWGAWLDVAFIAVFVYFFLARFLARIGDLRRIAILGGLAGYWVLERVVLAMFPAGTLAGSIMSLPALATAAGRHGRVRVAAAEPGGGASRCRCGCVRRGPRVPDERPGGVRGLAGGRPTSCGTS